MDGNNPQELSYYRNLCDELGQRLLQLQAEKTRTYLDAARKGMLIELISNAYRLENDWATLDDIEQSCLQVILKALNVDCAALLAFGQKTASFTPIRALGFSSELPSSFTPPMLPEENCHINSSTRPRPLFDALCRYTGVPFLVWAFEPHAGLALLVGNHTEDQHLHRPFDTKDYEIVTTALLVFIDIADRIRSKQALMDSEEKYRLLVENANDAIFVVQDDRITFANSKTTQMSGHSLSELNNMPIADLIHPEDRDAVLSRYFERVHGKDPSSHDSFRITDAGDHPLWIDLNVVPIEWAGRPGTLNFARDMTHQKQLEEQLRNSQKMEAIGTLAGGIAHDFNNILSAIIGYTELAGLILPDENPARPSLNEVMQAANRAKELVHRILSFSQMHEQEQMTVRMDLIIREVLKLLRPSLPATIEIEQHIDCQGAILADPTQIHQVVLNLCTNAYHAMLEAGGRLQVYLAKVRLLDDSAEHLNLLAGDHIKLTITDTGYGMTEQTMQRIFDPYFTTKENGTGTGLGLSVVYGIVSAHEGAIQLNSVPGKGTTFEVFFPSVRSIANREKPSIDLPLPGNERILFVDDESVLVRLATQTLEKYEYRVTGHTNPEDALALFRTAPNEFDLVITDMTMPHMTGDLFAKALKEIRPDIPIIITTGYSEKMSPDKAKSIGTQDLIMKPLNFSELTKSIRKIFDWNEIDAVDADDQTALAKRK